MNFLALSTLLLSFPRFTPGKPVQGIPEDKDTGETYMRQDDIVYRRRTQRSAMKCNERCVWPRSEDGLVNIPINVSTEFSMEERAVIAEALQEFVTLTCIRFIRRSTEHDYINISPAHRCWSYFGKIGGKQQLGLAKNGCMYKGLIQHEINHALGFIHEQARNDRDKYVKIHLEYVTAGDQGNFEKVDSNNLGLPYDYGSVMHYGPYDFSSASGKATIVPIPNASVPIGQRIGLSNLDVKKINKLYSCNCCSTVLRNRRGNFSSNNYPYSYPKNVTCLWLIQIPEGKVFLKFHVLDLQHSPHCASDYIRIYDGNNRNAHLLVDKLCGVGQLPALVSSGSMMLVEFVSDEAATSKGFAASFARVICGGTFTSTHGVVTSPNFPRKYPPNQKCLWIISAPAGSRISVTVGSLDLEEDPGCNYDRLVFHDGGDSNSPLFGTFCGKTEVPAFNSTGSFLCIEFYSDIIFQYSGFKLDYSIILPS